MATVPTPATQTAGLVVPAATINSQGNLATYLAGRVESGGARRPLTVLRQTVAQSIPNATITAILFDTEDVDYDNGHSTITSTNLYTVGTTGWYWVGGVVAYATNATGARGAEIWVSGSAALACRAEVPAVAADWTCVPLPARLLSLTAGQTLELRAMQTSTVALNTGATGQIASCLSIQWASV